MSQKRGRRALKAEIAKSRSDAQAWRSRLEFKTAQVADLRARIYEAEKRLDQQTELAGFFKRLSKNGPSKYDSYALTVTFSPRDVLESLIGDNGWINMTERIRMVAERLADDIGHFLIKELNKDGALSRPR